MNDSKGRFPRVFRKNPGREKLATEIIVHIVRSLPRASASAVKPEPTCAPPSRAEATRFLGAALLCAIAKPVGSIARGALGNYDTPLHQLFQHLQCAARSQAHGLSHFRRPRCAVPLRFPTAHLRALRNFIGHCRPVIGNIVRERVAAVEHELSSLGGPDVLDAHASLIAQVAHAGMPVPYASMSPERHIVCAIKLGDGPSPTEKR